MARFSRHLLAGALVLAAGGTLALAGETGLRPASLFEGKGTFRSSLFSYGYEASPRGSMRRSIEEQVLPIPGIRTRAQEHEAESGTIRTALDEEEPSVVVLRDSTIEEETTSEDLYEQDFDDDTHAGYDEPVLVEEPVIVEEPVTESGYQDMDVADGGPCRGLEQVCSEMLRAGSHGGHDYRFTAAGLRGVVDQSVSSSNALRASLADVAAARARVWGGLAQYAPTVRGSLEIGRSHTSNSPTVSNRYAGVSLSLPLFTWGSRHYSVESARSSYYGEQFRAKAAEADLVRQTISVYLQFYNARHARGLFARNIADLERLLHSVRERERSGFASLADVAQIKADIASLSQEVVNVQRIMRQSRDELESLSGRRVSVGRHLPDLGRWLSAGEAGLIESALKSNPLLLASTYDAAAAAYQSKAVARRYLPQVGLNAEYQRNLVSRNGTDPDNWSIGVRLSMPLVDLATVSEISESKSRSHSAYYRSQDVRRETELRIRTLWAEMRANSRRLDLAKRRARQLQRVVRSREAQYRSGLIAIESLLDQKRLLASAEIDIIQARTDRFLSISQLLLTAGKFRTSMLDS